MALAYLPYLEENKTQIIISNPETSQAHYGWLNGAPVFYSLSSPKPFHLYINLMSPRLSDDQVDFSANINIYKDNQLIATIDSSDFIWLLIMNLLLMIIICAVPNTPLMLLRVII